MVENKKNMTDAKAVVNENSKPVNVDLLCLKMVNLSMQQNSIHIVRKLVLQNKGTEDLHNLTVSLTPDMPFAPAVSRQLALLPHGQSVEIEDADFVIDAGYIIQLTEPVKANIAVAVTSEEETLYTDNVEIQVLPYNEWTGITIEPALLAAFVTPNNPAIATVTHRAAELLKEKTGDSALTGYQTKDANRVKQMMWAVYEALREQHIVYTMPPAGFEKNSQRVRLADEVLSNKMGTCLDTAVLLASCFEAMGINPLLIIMNDHAFAGAWLIDDVMPDNVIDDVTLLTKNQSLGNLLLVESTLLDDGKNSTFDEACETANRNLDDQSAFRCAVDVIRARLSAIRPLPQRIMDNGKWVIDAKAQEAVEHIAPKHIDRYEIATDIPEKEQSKQNVWERKLLDLSLRNTLLNFRLSGKTMLLLTANIGQLEDKLFDEGDFQIMPKMKDWNSPLRDNGDFDLHITEDSPQGKLLNAELAKKNLYSWLDESDNKLVMKALYRASKVSIEENGANSLYVALGMLRWYEPRVEKPHYAPILLLPVEMVRRGSGYVIRTRDEDTLLNVTLIELLRQNYQITIPGLDPLPTDESGIDVPMVFNYVRKAVLNQQGWDVEEIAVLGNFSFSKFIMWNDIHTNMDALRKNKIVDSLMTGKLTWDASDEMVDATVLDREVKPSDIALPVSSDSSQLEAIYAAANNKSFILHGPPGTGKSQTITNIIANALYQGKRVLFAAEKMAALSVVRDRLDKIGLGPFCLECHSNKAKKSDVLEQLKTASEVTKVKSPEAFLTDAEKLFALRQSVNGYVNALHKAYPCGVSLYEAITRYSQLGATEDKTEIQFSAEMVSAVDVAGLDAWNDAVDQLIIVAQSVGLPSAHPLRHLHCSTLQPDMQNQLKSLCGEAATVLCDIQSHINGVVQLCGLEPVVSAEKFNALNNLAQALTSIPELSAALLRQNEIEKNTPHILEVLKLGEQVAGTKADLCSRYTDGALNINAYKLINDWNEAEAKWFLPKWLGKRAVTKELSQYAKSSTGDTLSDLEKIKDYQEQKSKLEAEQGIITLFAGMSMTTAADWQSLQQQQQSALHIHKALSALTANPVVLRTAKENLANNLTEGLSTFLSMNGKPFAQLGTSVEQLNKLNSQLYSLAGLPADAVDEHCADNSFIAARIAEMNSIAQNIDKLKDRINYVVAEEKLNSLKLQNLTQFYAVTELPVSAWKPAYLRGFYHALADYIFSQEKELSLFKGEIFESNIQRLRELNAKYQQYIQAELYARLAANVPNFTVEAAKSSEIGILQKNIQNKGRGISLRSLFDSVPTVLSRLCPCMLMSPMSVAQYLDVNKQPKFDLVIFDEASQMPTSEAVGAIARGENVIVVGDPKQMPPTSFFATAVEDEDHPELNDMESILDDCLALSIPSKHLLWHYRSKHESLISFSNAQYYGNKLLTFPSPDDRVSKVTLVKVDGCYDKGKSRQNKAEAKAVVDEVLRRLSDPVESKHSIGIVTFSIVQQALIDDMLTDELAKRPELDAIANNSEEPLFIKNLENVQGDERDVILFSVGYGPDANGKVSMNFGPLNLVGGERRLNVAVSRARYEMKVFTTLTADMIDLNRTSAEGVKGLREFLDFAQKGTQNIIVNAETEDAVDESIANVVAAEVRKAGFDVDVRAGCSGFRVDVAVVDPKDKGKYILGILCDGDSYRDAKTARDREVCQPGVLSALGWNIIKVWTVDWYENKDKVLDRIKQTISDIQKGKWTQNLTATAEKIDIQKLETAKTESGSAGVHQQAYKAVELKAVGSGLENFIDNLGINNSLAIQVDQVKKLLQTEAPITKNNLSKRILSAWGVSHSPKTDVRIDKLLDLVHSYTTTYQEVTTCWISAEQAQNYALFRTGSDRDSADVPVVEYANAMLYVLGQQLALPEADLKKQASTLLGYTRMGTTVEAVSSMAVQYLREADIIAEKDGKLVINDSLTIK